MSTTSLDIRALVARADRAEGAAREVETVVGQHAVASATGRIVAVELVPPDPRACPEALDAVAEADWVVLGPGSWFSSVIPHLLLPELHEALVDTPARRMVTLNLSPEGVETEGFTPEMHLEVLATYAPDLRIDTVVADRASVPDEDLLRRVAGDLDAEVTITDVAMADGTPRHDPERLARAYADAFAHGRIGPWR
jgi:uncharacterized cofD-like protein